MAKKSATDWAESLSAMVYATGEKIRDAAVEEVTKYKGKHVEEVYLQPTGRKTFGGKTPDACILEDLADFPTLANVPRLQQALQRFQDAGAVSEDFRAGLLMAARLFQDPDFEY